MVNLLPDRSRVPATGSYDVLQIVIAIILDFLKLKYNSFYS